MAGCLFHRILNRTKGCCCRCRICCCHRHHHRHNASFSSYILRFSRLNERKYGLETRENGGNSLYFSFFVFESERRTGDLFACLILVLPCLFSLSYLVLIFQFIPIFFRFFCCCCLLLLRLL